MALMGNSTIGLAISLFTLTRLTDASESRSSFSVTQPGTTLAISPAVTTGGTSAAALGLPSMDFCTVLPSDTAMSPTTPPQTTVLLLVQ